MLNCKDCPWYDANDFTENGESYCRGIHDFGHCPYGKSIEQAKKEVVN